MERAASILVFQVGSSWTEGAGAKWRFVKYGLWFALRLQTLTNVTVGWVPNPAQWQNPSMSRSLPSMMGGLGIIQSTAPRPVVHLPTAWLELVASGEFARLDVQLQQRDNAAAEAAALGALHHGGEHRPLVLFVTAPNEPMHWVGSAGSWLHACFYGHRLARAWRSTLLVGAPPEGDTQHTVRLPRPDGTPAGHYVVGVHVRHFETAAWNLPGSYYVSAIRAVFDSSPLNCGNAAVLAIGDAAAPALAEIAATFDCAVVPRRRVLEEEGPPQMMDGAGDDYAIADEHDDARRGFVFRDLEMLGLSDVLITSNSEFSALAQSLSSPHTIVLCAPRRPGEWNRGLPCDAVGVPASILTHPTRWGLRAVPSDELRQVNATHVRDHMSRAWRDRVGARGTAPLWDQAVGVVTTPSSQTKRRAPRPQRHKALRPRGRR